MSHYDFDREETNENAAFGTECPLPTYEQACAATREIGLKRDAQFTPIARGSDASSEREERINLRDGSEELDDVPVKHKCRKYCCTAITVFSFFFLIYVTNVIVGNWPSNSHPHHENTVYEQEIHSLKKSFGQCIDEKENLQTQVSNCLNDEEIKELKNYRRTSEKQISDLNDVIIGLRSKLSRLTFETMILKHKVLPAYNSDEQTTKPVSTTVPTPPITTNFEDLDDIIKKIGSGNLGGLQQLIHFVNTDLKKKDEESSSTEKLGEDWV